MSKDMSDVRRDAEICFQIAGDLTQEGLGQEIFEFVKERITGQVKPGSEANVAAIIIGHTAASVAANMMRHASEARQRNAADHFIGGMQKDMDAHIEIFIQMNRGTAK